MKTAVEWYEKEVNALIDKYEAKEISKRDFIIMKHNLFYHAKQMEKEQIFNSYEAGFKDEYFEPNEYYNETYKNTNE